MAYILALDTVLHTGKFSITHNLNPCIDARRQGQDAPAGRTMVFAATDEEARAAARPLRNVLWGDHKMSVLLPSGAEPIVVRIRGQRCIVP